MIDRFGYRLGVGIILLDQQDRVFCANRVFPKNAWQCPQGGIELNESIAQTGYRELYEETGVKRNQVQLLAMTSTWLSYDLPKKLQRPHSLPLCVGQRQRWLLFRLCVKQVRINFDPDKTGSPEFDHYQWVDYDEPVKRVVDFKKELYAQAFDELKPFAKIGIFKYDDCMPITIQDAGALTK